MVSKYRSGTRPEGPAVSRSTVGAGARGSRGAPPRQRRGWTLDPVAIFTGTEELAKQHRQAVRLLADDVRRATAGSARRDLAEFTGDQAPKVVPASRSRKKLRKR